MSKEKKIEFECDRNCPIDVSPAVCCRRCMESRKYFIADSNKHLWTEDFGFYGQDGCKLERDQMPKECLEYSCKNSNWLCVMKWDGKKWIVLRANAINLDSEVLVYVRKESGNSS